MPSVLLITEQERLKLLFAGMQSAGMFRLRVAPTLAQAEEEIAARLPHFVFVENHLSGQTGSAILSYLRGLVPEGAEVVLLARNVVDADDFRESGGLFSLDLSESNESLQSAIADLIPLSTPATPENPPPSEPLAPPKAARELLFRGPGQEEPTAQPKRAIWFILLAVAVISLSVIAFQAGNKPPPAQFRQAATVPTKVEGDRVEPPVAPAPAPAAPVAPKRTVNRAAERVTTASTVPSAAPQTLSSYVVQPNDKLLRVLVKNFGFTYSEALGVVPELRRINNLKDLNLITPGQVILIPASPKPDKEQ